MEAEKWGKEDSWRRKNERERERERGGREKERERERERENKRRSKERRAQRSLNRGSHHSRFRPVAGAFLSAEQCLRRVASVYQRIWPQHADLHRWTHTAIDWWEWASSCWCIFSFALWLQVLVVLLAVLAIRLHFLFILIHTHTHTDHWDDLDIAESQKESPQAWSYQSDNCNWLWYPGTFCEQTSPFCKCLSLGNIASMHMINEKLYP